jgi:hypothetical protein
MQFDARKNHELSCWCCEVARVEGVSFWVNEKRMSANVCARGQTVSGAIEERTHHGKLLLVG